MAQAFAVGSRVKGNFNSWYPDQLGTVIDVPSAAAAVILWDTGVIDRELEDRVSKLRDVHGIGKILVRLHLDSMAAGGRVSKLDEELTSAKDEADERADRLMDALTLIRNSTDSNIQGL